MSKHAVLTQEEFGAYSPNRRTVQFLEEYRLRAGLQKNQMNILDWGCGRGRDTLWFREQGYSAYGIDIDPEPISNGLDLLQRKGYDESVLRIVGKDAITDFPDEFFHFTFSNQVFEHVESLEPVAGELWRITRFRGAGFHVFPGHRRIIEGHLFMPLVQWVPKNELRRQLIRFCTHAGIEPRWPELMDLDTAGRAEAYYQYSIHHTFYRKPALVGRLFENCGFNVSFETINHPTVRKHWLFGRMLRSRSMRAAIYEALLTLESAEMLLQKHQACV